MNQNLTLSHLDQHGAARMVDVSSKAVTTRTAQAGGQIEMSLAAANAIRDRENPKGEVLQVARIAAIGAAKLTSNLIPLCHFLPMEKVSIDFKWLSNHTLQCIASVTATAKTGVEMEALTAVSVGLLTVYDMLKAIDKNLRIGEIALWNKQGGKSGPYQRDKSALEEARSEN